MAEKALYFIALVPPEPILGELWLLKKQLASDYGARAALKSPPHITLHMPFRYRSDRESGISDSLGRLCSDRNPFPVELNNFNAFAPRVIYVDVTPQPRLNSLQSELHKCMKRDLNVFNADYKNRPFRPHLTVLFRDLKKAAFNSAWDRLKNEKIAYEFNAEDICLLRHNGKSWDISRRIPLKGTA